MTFPTLRYMMNGNRDQIIATIKEPYAERYMIWKQTICKLLNIKPMKFKEIIIQQEWIATTIIRNVV